MQIVTRCFDHEFIVAQVLVIFTCMTWKQVDQQDKNTDDRVVAAYSEATIHSCESLHFILSYKDKNVFYFVKY